MRLKNKKKLAFAIASLSLMAGCSIYMFFREPPLVLRNLISNLGLTDNLIQIRSRMEIIDLSTWILYGLPDLLWMFSFTLFILAIWDYKFTKKSVICLGITIITALSFEVFKSNRILKGLYDINDLLFKGLGILPALTFTIKNSIYEKST